MAGTECGALLARALAGAMLMPVPAFVWRIEPHEGAPRPEHMFLLGVNGAYAEAVGVDPEGFAGRHLPAILPQRGVETVMANISDALGADAPFGYDEELDVSGRTRVWHTVLRVLRGPDGAPFGIVGCANDITDHWARSSGDADALARMSRLVKDVQVFASMAAHDVRSPLATIRTLLAVVRDGFADLGDGKAELLAQAVEVARRAQDQMDALLARANMLEDAPERFELVDMGHLCRDVAALIDPSGSLEITYPEETLVCDPVTLQLVLRNLLSNAARHCRGRINVVLRGTGSEGLTEVLISDDGPGFAQGRDPFAIDGATRLATGHGYGLAGVRHVLESRGGTIRLAPSAFGRGGGVAVTLPGRRVDPYADMEVQSDSDEGAGSTGRAAAAQATLQFQAQGGSPVRAPAQTPVQAA